MIRIAIVDDEKVIREQIMKLIEKKQMDCVVDTYSSGEEVLENGRCYDVRRRIEIGIKRILNSRLLPT